MTIWTDKRGWKIKVGHSENEPSVLGDGVTPAVCKWHHNNGLDCDYWETDCGEAFTFIDGGPHDNKMKYCCYCGGELIEE